ncbi:MAG TPA: hypothetical protein VFO28_17610 [Burkholderiaceae bacterium]|nr:hypothetical protein [Burkholderiaceae bacterium]
MPQRTDPAEFVDWTCERIDEESDRVQLRAADVAYAVDARSGNNLIAFGVGVMVFWPALLAMRPDGIEAQELAALKGRHEALRSASRQHSCPPPPETMSAQRAARLPLATGERFVYEERASSKAAPQELGLRVQSLKRDRIEFSVDMAGQALPGSWSQDLAGNSHADNRVPLIKWRRLLQPDMQLGQVLTGDLYAADPTALGHARLRGQVVAQGVQTIAGRSFDVAVIELFGDAPMGDNDSTRLSGVMAVDRTSGLLLRLELSSANPTYAMRRRLVRVEPPAG